MRAVLRLSSTEYLFPPVVYMYVSMTPHWTKIKAQKDKDCTVAYLDSKVSGL